MKKAPLPIVNKVYYAYDDGKIKETREKLVKITNLMKPHEMPPQLYDVWQNEVQDCPWLYDTHTDYVATAISLSSKEIEFFVRTIKGEWFSVSMWDNGSLLDIENKYHDSLK